MILIERLILLASSLTFISTFFLGAFALAKKNSLRKDAEQALEKALASSSKLELENVIILYSNILDKDVLIKVRRRINDLIVEEDFKV